jgi:hypothetical protein
MSNQARDVVFKSVAQEKRIVWAEVYSPDRPDADKEFMRAPEIEKMAYNFMRSMKLDSVDSQHDNVLVDGCCVVESFIARKGDPDFIEGAWVVGMHIDNDAMWEKIGKGEINGFSIEAMVIKDPQTIEMDIPSVLSGNTLKADDHSHDFLVAYDNDGNFLGGKTSVTNDHFHAIKRGTVTEDASGHSHRFSHVEELTIQ